MYLGTAMTRELGWKLRLRVVNVALVRRYLYGLIDGLSNSIYSAILLNRYVRPTEAVLAKLPLFRIQLT